MYDIARFTLADMTDCGETLRQFTDRAESMEEAAELMVRFLYSEFLEPESSAPAFSLVRLFKPTRMRGCLQISEALQRVGWAMNLGWPRPSV